MNGLLIDIGYCSGCRSCEIACRNERELPLNQFGIKVSEVGPFLLDEKSDTWEWNYVPSVTSLCDLCEDRVARGEQPSCVLHCLASALEYGSVEDLAKKMANKGTKACVMIP